MVDRPDLDKLIAAAKQHKMTDAELAEQRASWVRGEMGMGETSVMKRQAIDLDELIKLHKTATEGRWNVQDFSPAMDSPKIARDVTISCSWPDHIGIASMNNGLTATLDEARANATFIAEFKCACDDGLLERLRAAEARVAELDAENQHSLFVVAESYARAEAVEAVAEGLNTSLQQANKALTDAERERDEVQNAHLKVCEALGVAATTLAHYEAARIKAELDGVKRQAEVWDARIQKVIDARNEVDEVNDTLRQRLGLGEEQFAILERTLAALKAENERLRTWFGMVDMMLIKNPRLIPLARKLVARMEGDLRNSSVIELGDSYDD